MLSRPGDFYPGEEQRHPALPAAANAPTCLRVGESLFGQGQLAQTAGTCWQALHLAPDSADGHYGLALAFAGLGRRPEAIDHFRHALRLRPGHADALPHLGIALAELGQMEEALSYLHQAARERPDSAAAHHNLGVALAQHGNPREAAASLEHALPSTPACQKGRGAASWAREANGRKLASTRPRTVCDAGTVSRHPGPARPCPSAPPEVPP